MSASRFGACCLAVLMCITGIAFSSSPAHSEGFAIMENSARGMGLAGGLVARGGDASALAYNPASMTRLEGTQFQANLAVSQFYWGMDTNDGHAVSNAHSSHQTWPIPAFYLTHQVNDDLWLGFASFTRFGLGVKYPNNWPGGYNLQSVQLITDSFQPTLAYRINDMVSIGVGAEFMYADMQMRRNLMANQQVASLAGMFGQDLGDVNINGHGWGFGGNVSLHVQPSEQWSMGLVYRAPVSLKVNGKARYDNQVGKMAGALNGTPYAAYAGALSVIQNSNLHGTLNLPDSFSLGVSYAPMKNLSFEADATYTMWSRFKNFNIHMENPVNQVVPSDRHWRNSWAFALSVEYKPVDWIALRLGTVYDMSPQNYGNSDYMVPSNSRNYYTAGVGFNFGKWTVDLAYMYIYNHVLNYTESAAHRTSGVVAGRTTHPHAHNFGIGIGYKF